MATNFTYGSGNPLYVPPKPAPAAKKVETKADIDKRIAATNAKIDTAMIPVKSYVESQGYVLDPNTGQYVMPTPTGGGSTGGGETVVPPPPVAPPPPAVVKNSAYDLLQAEFNRYGLGSLVSDIKNLITNDTSAGELTLLLRQTDAYKKRFAANAARIEKGLTALDEASYLAKEDAYQNIMRNYGLPESYWKKDAMGTQEGFTKLLTNDVSAVELEDRIATAQNRVVNANPQVKEALKKFYPNITDGDILAYSLDPAKALTDIKRKVTAAEIGGAALGQGLSTNQLSAEGLAAAGVTKQQAEQGYGNIAEFLPTGQKLSQVYGESPYTQQQAESEIFNLADSAAAAKKRKRLSQLETSAFSGSSGAGGGALSRDRAGNFQQYGAPGAGAY
jgi:LysM repeat protein